MSFLELYLMAVILPGLKISGAIISMVSGVIIFIIAMEYIISYSGEINSKMKKCLKYSMLCFILGVSSTVLIPSKSDLILIYSGQYLTNNENIKQLPDNMATTLNKITSSYLEEKTK